MQPSARPFSRRWHRALPLALLSALLLFVASASGSSFPNAGVVVFNDGKAAQLYPSTIPVSGLSGTVTNVTVTLTSLSHALPEDLDVLLVGPGGEQATIMSDVGGSGPVGPLTLTLDDAAAGGIPTPLTGGTYKPTNNTGTPPELDTFPLSAPAVTGFPTGPSSLAVFNTTDPTGTWRLYVVDDGNDSAIGNLAGGWSMSITTTGSPATVFSNAAAINGADRPPPPLQSSPYPSAISVSGFSGVTTDVVVTLNGFRHTFADDVDLLLSNPAGQNAIIMSDVGGGADVQNLTIILDDAAVNPLPDSGPLGNGSFQPTNVAGGDVFPAPAPAPLGGTALSSFDGTSPNGTWNLWAVDDTGIDSGYLTGGWSLDITGTTAVGVSTMSAAPGKHGILVRWRTGTESQILGFNVYRGSSRVNRSLIKAKNPGQAVGAAYRFLDRTATVGSHVYRLQVVRRDGTRATAGTTTVYSSK